MAEQIQAPVRNPQASTIETLKPQVQVNAQTSVPSFSNELTAMAFTPTLMGTLGAQMANSASSTFNALMGQKAGEDPKGNLLPPITSADKAYVEAYSSQAQATLGLQAQKLFDTTQEQINQAERLTPDLINTYKENLSQGLEDILNNAPHTIRGDLANSFATNMESSVHKLNNTMIGQQKAIAKQNAELANNNNLQQIHSTVLDGKAEDAEILYQSSLAAIDSQEMSGQYTPAEAESLRKSAKINYESAKLIKQGIAAIKDGVEEQWYKGLIDKKPDNLDWTEFEAVRSNAASYIQKLDSFDRAYQQTTLSDGYRAIAEGRMTPTMLKSYEGQLDHLHFNNLAIAFSNQQRSQTKNTGVVDNLSANWSQTRAWEGTKDDQQNLAFARQVQQNMSYANQNGRPISLDEAEFQAAASAARPVPAYIQKLNYAAQSGNGQEMFGALQTLHKLQSLQGNKAVGITNNTQSMAMLHSFEGFLNQKVPVEEAAMMAKEVVVNKDENTIKLNNTKIQSVLNTKTSTPSRLNSFVNDFMGVPSGVKVTNQTALNAQALAIFKENMQWTNGDIEVSKKMAQTGTKKAWGITHINGVPEYTFMPLEQVMGLSEDAIPIIQTDIAQKLLPQIAETKAAFDSGALPFYYEVKQAVTLEDFEKAKLSVMTKGLRDPEYAHNHEIMKQYKSGNSIRIDKVYRNEERKSYRLNVQTTPWAGFNGKTGEFSGEFDIGLVNEDTGLPEHFEGYFGRTQTLPVYRPDVNWIKSKYIAVNGLGEHTNFWDVMKEKNTPHNMSEYRQMLRKGTLPRSPA